MNKQNAAQAIIEAALPLVPFEGWNVQTLRKAAVNIGFTPDDVIRIFPHGAISAANAFSRMGDEKMEAALAALPLETMRIPERIALAVRTRLEAYGPHREAVRKIVALHAMPFHALDGLRSLYDTVDAIWRSAGGDRSTDFNFYSKRIMLAGVYSSTLLFWIDDKSDASHESYAFLDRRLENVALFGQWKKRLFNRRT
jgi:ubiquinone biosynthesis protein COQ9